MKKISLISFVLIALLAFSACNDDNESNARFTLRLTDAPADYEEVLIDIQQVKVNVTSADNEEGTWYTMDGLKAGVYNLLDFTNGMDTVIADQYLPVGKVSQIRLILGENNQVKKDGVYHDLKTPSAQQSGLKLNVHAELKAGIAYRMWLDFDAGRSIVETGNGKFNLKPVIRTFTQATSGAIEGTVVPVKAKPYVMAISEAEDTFATYADTVTGYFLLRAIPEGTFKLKVDPVDGYVAFEKEDVSVVNGAITNVGELTIEEIPVVTE